MKKKKEDPKIECHNKNPKVGKNTLVFNMSSAFDCPSDKLGLCGHSKICYAKKSERQYPQVLPYRRRQAKQWQSFNGLEIAKDIESRVKRMRTKIEYLRINESGDFATQMDIEKLDIVARYLLDNCNIKTYTYSARKDLDFDGTCFCVNGSGFMLCNQFQVVDKVTSKIYCKGDCTKCTLCKVARGIEIQILAH